MRLEKPSGLWGAEVVPLLQRKAPRIVSYLPWAPPSCRADEEPTCPLSPLSTVPRHQDRYDLSLQRINSPREKSSSVQPTFVDHLLVLGARSFLWGELGLGLGELQGQ